MLGSNVLYGAVPEGHVTATAIHLDSDYLLSTKPSDSIATSSATGWTHKASPDPLRGSYASAAGGDATPDLG